MSDNKLAWSLGGLGAAGIVLGLALRWRAGHGGPATGLGSDGRPGTAVITGGTSGIGAAFAHELAAQGYDLLLIARHENRLVAFGAELASRYHVVVETVAGDLSRAEDVERVAAHLEGLPGIAILVNNAGFGTTGRFAEIDVSRQLDMIRLHDVAGVRLARAVLPGMIARCRGGIINVASLAAFVPLPGGINYSASKAFLVMFSEALQLELAGTGVRVQALCPGFTHTEFHGTSEFADDDRAAIPGFLWMQAGDVVSASLAGLRRGDVICVPGLLNKGIACFARSQSGGWLIRRFIRRIKS